APMKAPQDTLIAFATSPGALCPDGKKGNSLYASEFVRALSIPNLNLDQLFSRLGAAVAERSRRAQRPWRTTAVTQNLVLTEPVPGGGVSTALWDRQRAPSDGAATPNKPIVLPIPPAEQAVGKPNLPASSASTASVAESPQATQSAFSITPRFQYTWSDQNSAVAAVINNPATSFRLTTAQIPLFGLTLQYAPEDSKTDFFLTSYYGSGTGKVQLTEIGALPF